MKNRMMIMFTVVVLLTMFNTWGGATDWGTDQTGTSYKKQACLAQSGTCGGWLAKGKCENRNGSTYENKWFTCEEGGTVWLSLKIIDARAWGTCTTAGSGCVSYQIYNCALIAVYPEVDCGGEEVCEYFTYTECCDPYASPF